MSELLSRPWLIIFTAVIVGVLAFHRRRSTKMAPLPDLPWLNTREGELFTILRARFRTFINFKQTIDSAYEQYSKRELSCIVPSLANATILLPPSHIPWLINQPESVLSANEPHIEQLQTELTFSHPRVVQNPLHHDVVKSELTRQVGNLTEEIADEIAVSLDELWGTDTKEWKEVCVFETVIQVVARTSNRAFIGLPLCRDRALLDHAIGFATALPTSSFILSQIPALLRPFVSIFATQANRKHTDGFAGSLRPEIERRKQILDAQSDEMEKRIGDAEPNDFLQWSLLRGRSQPQEIEYDSDIIAERVLAVNFAAIHTSTFSITNVLLDLLSLESSQFYLDQLREEATTTLARDGGFWSKKGLARMYKLDSALRESTRLGSFLGTGLLRKVMAPSGITAPNGTHCPYGSMVCVPSNGVHNDPKHYPDAAVYNPFRFSSQRRPQDAASDDSSGSDDEKTSSGEYIRKANLSFVSTSPSYHPFGHGRHACPGRFFAANELKLMLAYMVQNYDFETLRKRPDGRWIGPSLVPPMKATIRIRRR